MIIINAVLISALAALVSSVPFGDRGKREPNGRAMTWSGWMPNGGMTLFASSADDNMWNLGGGLRPPTSTWQDQEFSWKNQQEPVERKLFTENDEVTLKPFDDTENNFKIPRRQPFDDERERRVHNDKPRSRNPPRKYDDDEEYDRRSSGSNANASFNAWFPIMLGMYPSDGSRSSSRNHNNNNNDNYGPEDDGKSMAAIANSVNHGRSGVASSHAVIYTGQPRYNHKNK